MRSIVILGAGDLGGTVARHLAAADFCAQVTLVDDAGTVAEGKALDILQAAPVDRYTTRVSGSTDASVVIGADAIVLADRHASNAEWQGDAAAAAMRRAAQLNMRALLLCAGALQLDVVERCVREAGLSPRRLFGSAPEALRSAMVAVTALEAGCSPCDISLTVVGRPPAQIIIPWEDASIGGRRATEVLTPPAMTRLDARSSRLWPPGPTTLAAAATRVLSAAARRTQQTVSAFVAGERIDGDRRAGMLPIIVTPSGIGVVLEPRLSARDRVRLETALHR